MNGFTLLNGSCCYLELRQGTLQVLDGERGLELPLERNANGRLTEACKAQVTLKLEDFFRRQPWQPWLRALCAVGVRGVSLRRISVPATTHDNLQRVLRLQVEAEFPVSPDELAWGYQPLGTPRKSNGDAGRMEVLVAAVKKDAVELYAELLAGCGVTPLFTVAALARGRLCPDPPATYSVLDIGRHHSELVCYENGVPTTLRLLPWGGETITRALGSRLQLGRSEAETFKLKLESAPRPNGEAGPKIESAMEAAVEELAAVLKGHSVGRKIYLTGKSSRQKDIATRLARRLGSGIQCEPLELSPGAGRSAAVLGLQRLRTAGEAPLVLETKPTNGQAVVARPAPWKWVGIAAGLALAVLLLPYAEAFLLKSHLSRKLAAVKQDAGRLAIIDKELNFLEYLKQSEPPYLDTLFLFAKSAPQGSRVDSFTMNRRGELSWRGTLKDSQQVADFRSKLIASGMFANVTMEEQTPSPDRQKLTVRMSAQWKPLNARQQLALAPTAEEIEKARTNVHRPVMGAPMFPGGFPGAEGGPPPGMMPARRPARSGPMPAPPGPGVPIPGASMPVMPGGAPLILPSGSNLPPGQNPPGGPNP